MYVILIPVMDRYQLFVAFLSIQILVTPNVQSKEESCEALRKWVVMVTGKCVFFAQIK